MELRRVIENDSHLLKQLSGEITEKLTSLGVSEESLFEVRVAFEEALRNAMLHGNKMDAQKKVLVEAEMSEEKVKICVSDEGAGFDPEKIPDPTDEENILKTSGRGVYIIRHFMDEVKYENGGRKVSMIKCFSPKLNSAIRGEDAKCK